MLKARVRRKSVKAWRNLLLINPNFENIAWYCPKGIVALLTLKPELAERYDWNIDFLNAEWTQLLMSQPQFADKCPYLNELDAFLNWLPLLKRQPGLRSIAEKYRDRINIIYRRFPENLGKTDLLAHWERCITQVYSSMTSTDSMLPRKELF